MKKHIRSKKKVLYFFIYCTVLHLNKLKLKEPEENYENTNCISIFKSVI